MTREYIEHRNAIARALCGLCVWLLSAVACVHAEERRPPNVVVIFIDDMGYADIGPFGAKHNITPNLDRLAQQGLRFTDFYVAQPICTASRAALLTGCYANRIGLNGALFPGDERGINERETTLAEMLRERGYATAIFGKWHLGDRRPFLPLQHGFDEFFGIPYSNDMVPENVSLRPYLKAPCPPLPLYDGDAVVETIDDQSELTWRFTQRAVAFIERHRDRPFFVYLPHPMVHVPLAVSAAFRGKTGHGLYADTVAEVDWSVGEIMAALDRTKLADDTVLMFLSDNGPWLVCGNHAGSAEPLREGKQTVWDGGVRVPFLIRWPGHIRAGSVESTPAMTIDLLPTIAKWTGSRLPAQKIDGRDLSALFAGAAGATNPHEAYFFYNRANELQAVRSGRWKLVFAHEFASCEGVPPARDGAKGSTIARRVGLSLFDLQDDPGERTDQAAMHPEIVARLQRHADAMRAELGDALTQTPARDARPAGGGQHEPPPKR